MAEQDVEAWPQGFRGVIVRREAGIDVSGAGLGGGDGDQVERAASRECGIEGAEDLIDDLKQAFEKVRG